MTTKNEYSQELFLKNYDSDNYVKPSLTVDINVFRFNQKLQLLLIQRKNHPFINYWALPGGFVDESESSEVAAKRELYEETNLNNLAVHPLELFSTPNRDPRTWVISHSFYSIINSDKHLIMAKDDAKAVRWFDLNFKIIETNKRSTNTQVNTNTTYQLELVSEKEHLSARIVEQKVSTKKTTKKSFRIKTNEGLAFDHSLIVTKALISLKQEIKTSNTLLDFMPEFFNLAMLKDAYETIIDIQLTENQLLQIFDSMIIKVSSNQYTKNLEY